ncbi:DUF222 domain-containing protein [Actinomycetospora sp. TBRC 11914]|uniref:DUF222 domain-containing protein n=1 Tax=Actinomycetospora sp. TBRC 11914 TaxID=2729387 RepID=UPI00145F643B|nr:DUF222 domain-containing protein [Actinomycetospora sp. TBRC 11914]NMO91490.1 DUF222 domain-containing protein [Actinomycetospora sp. TBRC 11914]
MSSNEAVGDAVSAELAALLARLGELAVGLDAVPDAVRIDRIALLEQTRAALAAAQHTEMVAFAGSQVAAHEAEIAAGRLDPRKLGTGIADQIALAAHVSPWQGSRRLTIARALATDLPHVRGLLAAGRISERLAETVVAQTSHLDAAARRAVDKQLGGARLDELGFRRAEATVKKTAYETDPAGYTHRGRTARKDRRVTVRPAPDTMSVLSALLPVEQGVACLAALRRHADSLIATGDTDGRSRDQILADTLVERVTGQGRAQDVDVEVGIVLPLDALLDPDSPTTGELVGHGPLPAGIVRDLLRSTGGKRWWRRLFAHPAHGGLLGGDPQKRRFDGFLARLIDLRDHGRCRDPFCDAAIRHHDHIVQSRAGGPASLANGRGVCARGNYTREMPDWTVETIHDGHGEHPHTVRTTTPTGHTYTSRAGP